MKKSDINLSIDLDDQNIPVKILWDASDRPETLSNDTKAVSVSIWDEQTMNAMRIDLWTKEMTIEEMKRFYINSLGGMSQMILNSTGDEFMAGQTNELVDRLVEHLKKEETDQKG